RAAALLMNFRPEVTDLIRAAALESKKTRRNIAAEARRYLLYQGELKALPMRLGGLVCSPLWSLRAKLRLLAEPFMPAGRDVDESVSQFITRRLGAEVLEKAMEPFIAGTLAADPDHASATATLPRLTALECRYGSITAGILMNRILRRKTGCVTDTFSFQNGMSTLVHTLAETPGIFVRKGHRVRSLIKGRNHWQVTATTAGDEQTVQARQVVLATPAPVAADLLAPLNSELAALLRGIQYAPLGVVHLGFDRAAIDHPLDGTGFLTPRQAGLPISGNLWMSSLFPDRAPPGKVLLTTYMGGARLPQVLTWNDERMIDETINSLRPLLGLKGDPEMVRIDRHRHALPLYYGAYQARLQAIAKQLQQLPGLHVEANYHGGVSVRDRIARGRALAERIAATMPVSVRKLIPATLLRPLTSKARYSGRRHDLFATTVDGI
ncbi:MAG: protoporphyrinogen oxidase, partial [Gammaproteobacteria bacterium]